jgi:phage regulator Rha-like protein
MANPDSEISSKAPASPDVVGVEVIERRIFFIRGEKVMLDSDLARLYGVSTARLNEQVKRNRHRFPEDFMFQLNKEEAEGLRSQSAILKTGARGQHRKYLPYAFTEHGAVMLASVLNSSTAVQASIQVVRAFVRLRSILAAHKELAQKLEEMEKKYDARFREVFEAIRQLMGPTTASPKRPIGFAPAEKGQNH